MLRILLRCSLLLSLFVALSVAQAPAQDKKDGTSDKKDASAPAAEKKDGGAVQPEPDRIEVLLRNMAEIRKTLDKMEERQKLFGDDLERKLKTQLEDAEIKSRLRVERLQSDSDDLRKQMVQLRTDLESLRSQMSNVQSRVSLYAPVTTPAPTGRVRLVNTFPESMTVVVNERSYRLAPGATQLTDAMPPGTFTYQVLGVQDQPQTRTLAANETYNITVYPR